MTEQELKQRITDLNEALNQRNVATKVWIQYCTQTREYCRKLEKENEKLKDSLRYIQKICGSHNESEWAHILAVDIPHECETALDGT